MGKYYSCPACDNVEEGDRIWKCLNCGSIFCDSCGNEYIVLFGLLGNSWACPDCDESNWKQLGEIISADNE